MPEISRFFGIVIGCTIKIMHHRIFMHDMVSIEPSSISSPARCSQAACRVARWLLCRNGELSISTN